MSHRSESQNERSGVERQNSPTRTGAATIPRTCDDDASTQMPRTIFSNPPFRVLAGNYTTPKRYLEAFAQRRATADEEDTALFAEMLQAFDRELDSLKSVAMHHCHTTAVDSEGNQVDHNEIELLVAQAEGNGLHVRQGSPEVAHVALECLRAIAYCKNLILEGGLELACFEALRNGREL